MRLAVTVLSFLSLNFAAASSQDNPRSLPLTWTFIPENIEEHDDVQVVVSGVLPNTCLIPKQVKIERLQRQFYLDVEAKNEGCFCLPVEAPFFKVVNLGKLPAGSYWVQAGDLSLVREIRVEPSSTTSEDSLAYITSAKMIGDELLIRGKHFNTSEHIESVNIERQLDGTIVVSPVIGERKGLKNFVTRSFQKRIDLSEYIQPNFNHLVHIKSSQNRTFNVMVGVFNDPKISTKNEGTIRTQNQDLVTAPQ